MKSIAATVLITVCMLLDSGVSNAQLNNFDDAMGNVLGLSVSELPERDVTSLTGSEFVASIEGLNSIQREKAVVAEILTGNFPDFLRELKPVSFEYSDQNGRRYELTTYVMPDYLAVGSNSDYIRFPINLISANEIAKSLGFTLPTRKMVNQIYHSADLKLNPRPLKPSSKMTSTSYFVKHNQIIENQMRHTNGILGGVVAGHKKDVVLTNKLISKPAAIAIFGWHRKVNGRPIQPLSTVHEASYADYSHGIRLVSQWAELSVDGKSKTVNLKELIKDTTFSSLISDEGPILSSNDNF